MRFHPLGFADRGCGRRGAIALAAFLEIEQSYDARDVDEWVQVGVCDAAPAALSFSPVTFPPAWQHHAAHAARTPISASRPPPSEATLRSPRRRLVPAGLLQHETEAKSSASPWRELPLTASGWSAPAAGVCAVQPLSSLSSELPRTASVQRWEGRPAPVDSSLGRAKLVSVLLHVAHAQRARSTSPTGHLRRRCRHK